MKGILILVLSVVVINASELNAQRFTKITNSPLSSSPGDSRSVNWVDVNGDGFIDCFISNGPQTGQNNALYLNDQNGNFLAVQNDPIVSDNMPSDGATFADIDNDGDLDAFVVNWYNRNNLAYLNTGDGSFIQLTEDLWVNQAGYSETAAFGDFDNDGWVDCYVTNSEGNKRNFLYHNAGNGTMVPVTEGVMVTDGGSSRNVTWVDMDSDGDSDLFITNENNERNHVYRNDGNGVFTKLNDVAIATSLVSTMSSCWGDTDGDGDMDVFLANSGNINQYFRNEGNFIFTPFEDSDITLSAYNSFSCAWGDIDNDGDLDLFVTNAFKSGIRLKNLLYINDGSGHLIQETSEIVTQDLGWSYGCAFGDYDNDGFLDLAVATTRFGNVDESDYLYRNNGGENHYFMLVLEGTTSNRAAIGAIVRLKAVINGKEIWQMREVSGQSSYCGQNDLRVHFGLGDAVRVDSVIIEWPSGNKETMTHLDADQIMMIKESIVNSIQGWNSSIDMRLFPNPANSSVTVHANVLIPATKFDIEIANDSGRIVLSTSVEVKDGELKKTVHLDELNLVPGIYVLRLFNQYAEDTRKFVVLP